MEMLDKGQGGDNVGCRRGRRKDEELRHKTVKTFLVPLPRFSASLVVARVDGTAKPYLARA